MSRRVAGILFTTVIWAADPARWRPDLQALANELPQRHVNWWAAANRQQFESAVAELDRVIPDLTHSDVVVRLAQIVALGNDSHTSILLPQTAAPFRLVGLRFYWFPEGLYVIAAAPELKEALGARVVGIGDADLERAYRAASTVISHENDYWVQFLSTQYLAIPEVVRALGLAPPGPAVRYTLEDARGRRFTVDAGPGTPSLSLPDPGQGFTPVYQRRGNVNYWAEYLGSIRTLYFKYNQAVETPGRPFADFAREFLAALDANPAERVVFDVRNNTGGDGGLINALAEGMLARIERLRVYVIIGRQTASAGMGAAIPAKGFLNTLLLGEPTGGKPNHYGDYRSFLLPNSHLEVRYSTQFFTGPEGDALYPDVTVPITWADYQSRHDPVLAAVLAGTGPASAGPSAGTVVVVNAASFRAGQAVAPGSLASAFGPFGDGAVEVRVNGTAARVLAAFPQQINFQVPPETRLGAASVEVVRGGQRVASGTVQVAAVGPGLFAIVPRGRVLEIYATGQGSEQAQPRVYAGTEPAEVLYSGSTGQFVGLWQINAVIPERAGRGETPVFVTLGGVASNAVTVRIE
jgi:uncharacterized protein (TIGR03437 family)